MPYVASIGTYLPCWGTPARRVAGDDEDAITMAVEAGRAALQSGGARRTDRSGQPELAAPGEQQRGGAACRAWGWIPSSRSTSGSAARPRRSTRVSSARPRTLVIGVDLEPAGAAALLTAEDGLRVRTAARVARSLPVRTRNATGDGARLRRPAAAARTRPRRITRGRLAGHPRRGCRCRPRPRRRPVPRQPAAAADDRSQLQPLRACRDGRGRNHRTARRGRAGQLVGDHRQRRASPPSTGASRRPATCPRAQSADGAQMPISLAAYERAFEAKTRWEAGKFAGSDELDFPPRYRVADDGGLATRLRTGPAAADGHGLHRDDGAHAGARTAHALFAGARRTR